MLSAGEFRKGVTVEIEGQLYQVVDCQQSKIAQRANLIKARLRGLRQGHVIDRTFSSNEKFPRVYLDHRIVQYLYHDGDIYYFMDTKNFEQTSLDSSLLGDALNYLGEGMSLEMLSYKGMPMGVELPPAVELKVVDTGPGFKGDTATAGNKPATLETGLTIQVPLFINIGDTIKVDTRSGAYLERVN